MTQRSATTRETAARALAEKYGGICQLTAVRAYSRPAKEHER